MRLAWVVLLAGCGRIGFEPGSDGNGVIAGDALLPDSSLVVPPPTLVAPSGGDPALIWANGTFVLAYTGAGATQVPLVVRITTAGQTLGTPTQLSTGGATTSGCSVAVSGSTYVAVWSDDRGQTADLYGARLDINLTQLSELALVTTPSSEDRHPAVLMSPSGFAVLYEGGNTARDVRFVGLDAMLMNPTAPITVAPGNTEKSRKLVARSGGFAAAFREPTTSLQKFGLLSATGALVATPTRVTSVGSSMYYGLVATDTGYAIAWSASSVVYVTTLDASGAVLQTRQIAPGVFPALAWSGTRLGLTWSSPVSTSSQQYLVELDPSGTPLSAAVALSPDPESQKREPAIAWNGTGYGIVFHEALSGTGDGIYFTYVVP